MQRKIRGMFFMALAGSASMAGAVAREPMPTVYEAGHFFVTPPASHGGTLRLIVDSGGQGGTGMFVMSASSLHSSGWAARPCEMSGSAVMVTDAPAAVAAILPNGKRTPCSASAFVDARGKPFIGEDGVLGAGYLPGATWTFDYPQEKLWREASGWRPTSGAHPTALHLPRTADGDAAGLPGIDLTIDGETMTMLLDTGATARPTEAGKAATGIETVNGFGVTSYAPHRLFEKWHVGHPDWELVDDGDALIAHTRLIRVPAVQIAGWSVGPIWFTERSDANIDFLNDYASVTLNGSVGANVFRAFRMTLDYPHDTAWFDCVTGCKAVAGAAAAGSTKTHTP